MAGVDEAGRGPLAGPVVAAAVILDDLKPIRGLADSKALSARRRAALFDEIRAKALACCIAEASVDEIDRLDVLQATAAGHAACRGRPAPAAAPGAGRWQPPAGAEDARRPAIVQGDSKVPAISAASILAKVHRDRLCEALHADYPAYNFVGHKGYPTAEHLAALRQHGACPAHRRSYAPVRAVIEAGAPDRAMTGPLDITSKDNPLLRPAQAGARPGRLPQGR